MKIGLIRETKIPEDNRVALTPEQLLELQEKFPAFEFQVQSSKIRSFSDQDYARLGFPVLDSLQDCQVLFGIKEPSIDSLLANKHYFFFGHLAKFQEHNRALLQALLRLGITFSDYEYLVDSQGQRLSSFSWWAGFVGAYNSLRAYGLRQGAFSLPAPDASFTAAKIYRLCDQIARFPLKILITGSGQASAGAQHLLSTLGFELVNAQQFLEAKPAERGIYTFLTVEEMLQHKAGASFSLADLAANPADYQSSFFPWALAADVLLVCHFWNPDTAIHLSREQLRHEKLKLQVIGDITCDIPGSIESSLRATTHNEPFYDYNPHSGKEEPAFSDQNNISCMVVDSLPNALPQESSRSFGKTLSEILLPRLLEDNYLQNPLIAGATIVKDGLLSEKFSYLQDFAEGKSPER